tara:strand:- start:55 stop:444 length:390 start_codon:yes stop_codon:yes gene_type:complete
MASFAEINVLHKVIRVLVLDNKDTQDADGNEVDSIGEKYLHDGFGGTWLRTSRNTRAGVHKLGGTPYRKNFAGIGYTYDQTRDAFISPKPYASWVLNETTCNYDPPVAYPNDGKDYKWNEAKTKWDEIV